MSWCLFLVTLSDNTRHEEILIIARHRFGQRSKKESPTKETAVDSRAAWKETRRLSSVVHTRTRNWWMSRTRGRCGHPGQPTTTCFPTLRLLGSNKPRDAALKARDSNHCHHVCLLLCRTRRRKKLVPAPHQGSQHPNRTFSCPADRGLTASQHHHRHGECQ